jgi:hypothetical protein
MHMSAATFGVATATFLASGVEFVEAFTIVPAMGLTRSWRAALTGTAAALSALSAVTAIAGIYPDRPGVRVAASIRQSACSCWFSACCGRAKPSDARRAWHATRSCRDLEDSRRPCTMSRGRSAMSGRSLARRMEQCVGGWTGLRHLLQGSVPRGMSIEQRRKMAPLDLARLVLG